MLATAATFATTAFAGDLAPPASSGDRAIVLAGGMGGGGGGGGMLAPAEEWAAVAGWPAAGVEWAAPMRWAPGGMFGNGAWGAANQAGASSRREPNGHAAWHRPANMPSYSANVILPAPLTSVLRSFGLP